MIRVFANNLFDERPVTYSYDISGFGNYTIFVVGPPALGGSEREIPLSVGTIRLCGEGHGGRHRQAPSVIQTRSCGTLGPHATLLDDFWSRMLRSLHYLHIFRDSDNGRG